jgi:WD40 repeat protein
VEHQCEDSQPENAEASISEPEKGAGQGHTEPLTVPPPETPAVPAAPGEIPASRARTVRRVYLVGAAVLVVGMLTFVSVRTQVRQNETASSVLIPPGFKIIGRPAISPDGLQIAAAVEDAARHRQLWVESFQTGESRFLKGADGAAGPFWSPDGQSLAFVAGNEFKRISLTRGRVERVYAAVTTLPGAWAGNGTILYCPGPRMPLFTLETEHGTLPVTRKEAGETLGHTSPAFVDDGQRFVFLVPNAAEQKSAVYVASVGSFDRKLLLADASEIGYAPPDNLLYLRDGVLHARRFDFSRGLALGQEMRVDLGAGGARVNTFSVSMNGSLIVQFAVRDPKSDLVWRARDGKITGSTGQPGLRWQVTLAPDESAAAINGRGPSGEGRLELWRFGASSVVTLTPGTAHVLDGVWSPDSRSIAYQIYGREKTVLMVRRLDQPEARVLLDDGYSNYPDDWSPDGKWILCRRTANIVFKIAPDGKSGPEMLLNGDHLLDQLKFSPDGRWIAYNSDESGRAEVYVARFPKMDDVRQVSRDGGCQPLWRKDGKELFYLDPDGKLFSVDFADGPESKPAAPRQLFQSRVVVNAIIAQYAVTGDGNRFLLLEPHAGSEGEPSDGPLLLLRNWAARLQ